MGYSYIPGLPNYNAYVTAPREALTIGLDYYIVNTGVNILNVNPYQFSDVPNLSPVYPSVANFTNVANSANATVYVPDYIPNDFSQDALDKLIEIISQRGQPIIVGTPFVANGSAPFVYTFKFAVEHPTAWGVTSNSTAQTVPMLVNAITNAGADFGWNSDSLLSVTVSNSF